MSSAAMYPDRSDRFFSNPTLFVIGVWALMLAGALGFLIRFAVNVPYAEDGMLIPYVTGAEPLNMTFLWRQYSSHIIPLPKFVLYFLAWLTHDFRTAMYVSVLLCAVMALALTFVARVLRGQSHYTDAFFAISLLHLGHWESFLLGFAIQEVMSTGLLTIILLVILRSGATLNRGQALLAGICLILLPITGTAGFFLVPALAVWFAYSAWLSWRSDSPRASSNAAQQLILLLVAFAAMTPYYFCLPQYGPPSLHGFATLSEKYRASRSVFVQLLTISFGVGAATPWLPFLHGGRSYWFVGSLVLALSLSSLLLLLVRRQPAEERLRKLGLGLFLLAHLFLLAAIAFGRSGVTKTYGLCPRYSLYSAPLLWGIYFTWQLYGPRFGRQLVPASLFGFACAMFSLNMHMGYDNGELRSSVLKPAANAIARHDIPALDVASTYYRNMSGTCWICYQVVGRGYTEPIIREEVGSMVNMLRQAGIPQADRAAPRE